MRLIQNKGARLAVRRLGVNEGAIVECVWTSTREPLVL